MDYERILSRTAQEIKPSGIRKFFDLLGDMKDVIALTVGQPDFVTPWHIRVSAIESLEKGKTYYTSNSGTLELRTEIAAYTARRFGLTYDPKDEIIVTVGGSEAIDIAMRAIVNPGDEVIVPQPSFVCYGPIASLAGGTPVFLETKEEDCFKLTPDALRAAITPKTKLLVLPFPNNPTGAIMTREELEPIAKIVKEHDLYVISDEIYSELSYKGNHFSIASFLGMKERTLVINGFSKGFAMTGWRLGYVCGPQIIIEQMFKVHQYAIMCAPTNSQYAALVGLQTCMKEVEQMRESYDERRRFLMKEFRRIGLPCFEPFGAFYVFPCIKEFGMTSEEFATELLKDQKVAVVPGTAFGDCGEGFLRISYAYSLDDLRTAIGRLEAFIKKLRAEQK